MDIATIVPIPHLDLVEDDHYHLVITKLMLTKLPYYDFYEKRAHEGKFIIVDNGAAEGESATIEDVCTVAEALVKHSDSRKCVEIQLPDYFFDKDKTLEKSLEGLEVVKDRGWEGSIQGVPQGRNFREWVECAEEMLKWKEITCIGIPKNLVHTGGALGRLRAIRWMMDSGAVDKVAIHLLGCWTDPREVGMIYNTVGKYVRGVDSGIATIYAQVELELDPIWFPKPKKTVNFTKAVNHNLLKWNIIRWRDLCYGGLH